MEKSQQKTVVLTPRSGDGGGPLLGKALPNGYVLQGRYVIEKELGAGGFGITYLAKHRYLEDIWVAIKEYLPEGAAVRDETSRVHPISAQHDKIYNWGLHRFLDEARLLRQFQHPNIVAVEDFFEANDTAYLVMNYIRGRSIQSELDNGREFSEGDLRTIIYQLLDALNCIHRDGLYHRDISPDNILLREDDDSPVLIDFGSARYEMRMRGADRGDEDQAHTPTTIFKPGYSPVEQYEGTRQGPYTDIYALAATLYRIVFGVRPIDSLKRSGERRLTNKDPLPPAMERGKGRFSDDFLDTIDVALRIDPADRPQTIDAWLEHLRDHPQVPSPEPAAQTTAQRNRRLPRLLLAVLLAGVAAGGFYLWQSQLEPPVPDASDIPGTLAAANRLFASAPFDTEQQAKAGVLYRRVLDLDSFNHQALAALGAARLIQDFEEALAAENRTAAVVLLDDIEKEFREAGISVDTLANGWQRLERIRKQHALRESLQRSPLSTETWDEATGLLDSIRQLPGGGTIAGHGEKALAALRAAGAALQREEFAVSREKLELATRELGGLGIDSLPAANTLIDQSEASFRAQRLARIKELLALADQDLEAAPLLRASIEQAAARIKEVITLQEDHTEAQARSRLLEGMLDAYKQIDDDDFGRAHEALAAAKKIARSAGFDSGPVDRAESYLQQREQAWNTTRTQQTLAEKLAEASRLLGNAAQDASAIDRAEILYRQVLEMSGDADVFGAEQLAATQGIALSGRLTRIFVSLDEAGFAAARTALADPENGELARGLGIDPAFAIQLSQSIDGRELQWQREAATALLDGDIPLTGETHEALGAHVARILELAPNDFQATQLARALQHISDFAEARHRRDYPVALDQLKQAIDLIDDAVSQKGHLQTLYALVRDEAAAWDAAQRENRVDRLVQQAIGMLRQDPLSQEVRDAVGRVFSAVANIQDPEGRAQYGQQILTGLQSVNEAVERAHFDEAGKALNQVDAALAKLAQPPLASARQALTQSRERWLASQQETRRQGLADAASALRDGPLDNALLERLHDIFRTISGLHQGAQTGTAGMALVEQLRQILSAVQRSDFALAADSLDKAQAQLPAAGLDGEQLITIRNDVSAAASHFALGQTTDEIAELITNAITSIRRAPLDDSSLQQASDVLSQAMELNQTLPESFSQANRITAALETAFLLRAFAAELRDHQFDAMGQTVGDLSKLLPTAGLDPSMTDDLQQIALRAEADWRIAKINAFIAQGDWLQSRDLSPAQAQLEAIDALPIEHQQTAVWRNALDRLEAVFSLRSQRRFEEAQQSLAEAEAALRELSIGNGDLKALRERIDREQQRWRTLSEERDLVTWTGQAVAALDRRPFEPETWAQVETLIQRIERVRADDERGVALRETLNAVQQAQQGLADDDLPLAREMLQRARGALKAIGLETALARALADIDQRAQKAHAAQLKAATALLDNGVIDDARLVQAQTALQEVLQRTPDQPTVITAGEVLDAIIEARRSAERTHYAEASKQLARAGDRLNDDTAGNADPLPALRSVLQQTRQWLAAKRPSPAEIYPIISIGLRKISKAPLDIGELDAAESLLRNALGLQADEPSALGGLAAIEHLRATRTAVDNADAVAATQSLRQAEASLQTIGLTPSMLRSARATVEGMPR